MSLAIVTQASAGTASLTLSSGSGSPGGSVPLNLTFHSNGSQATGIQWTLNYSSTDFSSASVAVTPLATDAGEVLSCNSLSRHTTCLMINLGSNSTVIPDGVIVLATFHIASGTKNTSSPITFTNLSATNGGGSALALTGTGATVTINQAVSPVLSNLTCTPDSFTPPGTATCTASLSGAATSNVTVGLSSNGGPVTVPSSVSIANGNSSATFTAIAATAVTSNTSVTLTATLGGASRNYSLRLTAAQVQQPGVSSLVCAPNILTGGTNSFCTVTLAGIAPAGGTTVSVSTNNAYATPPAMVTVPAGQANVVFTVTTLAVSNMQTATLSATSAGVTKTSGLTIQPAPPVLTVPGPQSARPGETTTFKVSASDPAHLAVTLTVSGLPPGAMFAPINGTFTWVPDVSQIGLHTVQFTATNVALASTTADVQINVGSDTPVIVAFDNAASWSNDGGCSPGSVATLLGAGFVNMPGKAAEISPIPTQVNGVRVKANDVYLPLFYASQNQVNLQCPQFPPGQALTLVLESDTGTSPPLSTKMLYATPGIFTLNASGEGQGAVLIAGTGDVAMQPVKGVPGQPAKPGGYISIFANGLGPVDTTLTLGQPAPLDSLIEVTSSVDVSVGGSSAEVTFAGFAPGFTGLYQVNARIPGSAQPGDTVSLQIAVHLPDGSVVKSNVVTIAIAAN